MKKHNTLLLLLIALSATSFGQLQRSFKGQTADPTNRDWSVAANWVNNLPPTVPGDSVTLNVASYPFADTSNVDANFTIRRLANAANSNHDILLKSAPAATLTIDVNSDELYFKAPSYGIQHTSTVAYLFKIDGNVKIANSYIASNTNGNQTDIRVSGSVNNVIEFGPNSMLELAGNGALAAHAVQGSFNFNGKIKGTQQLIFSGNAGNNPTFTFGPTSDNSLYNSPTSVFTLNNNVNVVANTADNGSFFAGDKIQASGATAFCTLNGANIFTSRILVAVASQFTFTINKNQSQVKTIEFFNATTAKLKLVVDAAVTQLNFDNNSASTWTNGTVEISGFREGVIRFGTDNTGLAPEQLAQIKDAANPSDVFYLTATGYLTKSNPSLPITLTDLKARFNDKFVVLSWNTANEVNSDRFEIMRSVNGENFSMIGSVNAAGNNVTNHFYSFTDAKPLEGINYYRLNQYDVDGKMHASKVVTVTAAITRTPMKVFAISNLVNIEIENAAAGNTVVYIYDESGRVIAEQKFSLIAGYNLVKINKSLTKAIYFIKVINGTTIATQKFIVQ